VIGETVLDIQCRRGFVTVCAPDGPTGCPSGYDYKANVGVCGLATLNHFLNSTNMAGKYHSFAKFAVRSDVDRHKIKLGIDIQDLNSMQKSAEKKA
jgi:hypothetical protein